MLKRCLIFFSVALLVALMPTFLLSHWPSLKGTPTRSLLAFFTAWGMGGSLISLAAIRSLIKWFYEVQLVTLRGPHGPLVELIHRLSRRHGLTNMPEVGIYSLEESEILAVGPTKNRALIALSSGFLKHTGPHERELLLAQKIAHVANGDMVTMALAQGVPNAFGGVLAFVFCQLRSDGDKKVSAKLYSKMRRILNAVIGFFGLPLILWCRHYHFRDKSSL